MSVSTAPVPGRREIWLHLLMYPAHSLPTALAPMLVACGLAWREGSFVADRALAALVAAWLVQVGGIIADNHSNLSRNADDREHADFVRAMRAGVVTLDALRYASLACFAAAMVAGGWLVYACGPVVLAIGAAAIAAALLYSTGPYPLGDHGLGDPLFFAFFGLVSVAAPYWVQTGTVTAGVLLAGVPIGALTTVILVIDNIRDLDWDREKGEVTLAVLIGPAWSRVEIVALTALAYVVPVWYGLGWGYDAWVLLPLASLPFAVVAQRRILAARTYEELLPMTPLAGRVLLVYAVLAAVGFGVAR